MIEVRHPQPRKGFIDDNGQDRSPCCLCKHKNKMTIEVPCDNCIAIIDLALHKPCSKTTFYSFEPIEEGVKTDEEVKDDADKI